ncbi:MAG: serine acetyltransferase [Proteobacteria bacterium]|nr:serine acetyltransferase [Pseudomonadota bacterium]
MRKLINRITKLAEDIKADCDSRTDHRKKYHGDTTAEISIPAMLIKHIDIQSLAFVRLMQFAEDVHIPLGGPILSRFARYIYGSEIHWNAKIEPGVSLIHGTGVVIGHAAQIKPGCIIFHNVTIGEGRDPDTLQVGTPLLERNVHVGPGATILGPITIGEGTKIMAGAVLTKSVPPFSLVKSPKPQVTQRLSAQAQADSDIKQKAL